MTEWPTCTIEDLASQAPYSVVGGPFGSALGRKHYVEEGVPVIRGAQLGGPSPFRHDDLVFVTEEKADKHQGNLAFPGDLLVTQRGTVGQIGRVPEDAPFRRYLLSQSQMKLTVDTEKACARFVYYALKSPDAQNAMLGATISSGVPHINLTTFRALEIALPDLSTQRAVSTVLGSLDDLIENNQRRVKVLEEMASAIYREWFVYFRFPGHEDSTFVDSDLGLIPEGWSIQLLGDLATVDKGLSYKGVFLTDDGVPMANLKCIGPEGGFRRDGTKPYSGTYKPRHEVRPGDILIANTDLTQAGNVIGAPAKVPRKGFEDGGIISHHISAIRPRDVAANPWMYRSLEDKRFRDYARSVASGATVLGFRPDDTKAYPVVTPPASILGRFAETERPLVALQERLLEAAEGLSELRCLLLPKLVTGQIDVSDLDLDAVVERAGV